MIANNKIKQTALKLGRKNYPVYTGEFWTAAQRQAANLHEIAYRACFKPALPKYFIDRYTKPGDVVYDPFSGRGTTVIEAALLGRNIIANDINPLSSMLTEPRLFVPSIQEIEKRLEEISNARMKHGDHDLAMFYHPQTFKELLQLKDWLKKRNKENKEDRIDKWIRMVATNRLTGHSPGFFFSLYIAAQPGSEPRKSDENKFKAKTKSGLPRCECFDPEKIKSVDEGIISAGNYQSA